MFGIDAWIIWTTLLIIFLIAEALTLELVTIWFAIGSIAALILSMFDVPVVIQVIVMAVVSVLLLILFIYLIKPKMGSIGGKPEATNADRAVGSEGIVTLAIDPIQTTGLVKVKGQVWSALSEDEKPIAEGKQVIVSEIRGVKLIVREKAD